MDVLVDNKTKLQRVERALLLIYLRKGSGRTLLTTGYHLTLCGKNFNNKLVQCLDIEKEHCMKDKLALELTEVAWIMCTLCKAK